MYIDKQNMLSDAQTVAAGPSTDVIDFGSARDIGVGENLYMVVVAKEDLVGTLAVALETSDDNSTFAAAQDLGAFEANAVAGSRLVARLAPDALDAQYLRAAYAGATGGVIDTFITHDIDAYKNYKSGFTIS